MRYLCGRMKTMTDIFVELGHRLRSLTPGTDVVARACAANGWFTPDDVCRAVHALADDMLQRTVLDGWMARYPALPVRRQRRVLVVMAGNIPLVGFFDLLCVCMSGHACAVKPSSKDAVLMDYVLSELRDIEPAIPAGYHAGEPVDAVIATGSDNANRYFRSHFAGLPSLLRGSRHSVAVLSGDETPEELRALGRDVFSYSGLGCRNVSLIFAPRGAEVVIGCDGAVNPKYRNNYVQTRAVLAMRGIPFRDAGCAVLVDERDFPLELSRINIARYDSLPEVGEWLAAHDGELQCVVSRCVDHSRRVDFGHAQHPTLTDYADDVDTMRFLSEIAGNE